MENLRDLTKSYLSYCEKEKRLSKHTIKAYRIDLSQFCLHKKDMSIAKEDLVMYIHHLHENYKPKTVRRKIASLKAFIHYLYYQDVISGNPFDKIDTSFKEPLLLPRTIPAEGASGQLLSLIFSAIRAAFRMISMFIPPQFSYIQRSFPCQRLPEQSLLYNRIPPSSRGHRGVSSARK